MKSDVENSNESIEQEIANEIQNIKNSASVDDLKKLSKRGKLRLHKNMIRIMMKNDIRINEQCKIINNSGIKVSIITYRKFLKEEFSGNNEYLFFLKRNGWYRTKNLSEEEQELNNKIFNNENLTVGDIKEPEEKRKFSYPWFVSMLLSYFPKPRMAKGE